MIVLIIIILIILTVLVQYNTIIKLKLKVDQSKSGIDVYCQQRFDLIPNLVKIVKAYSDFEEKTFTQITELRDKFSNTKDLKTGETLNNKINNIIITVERYPELKANEQFLNLQKKLEKVENQLQAARRIYNNDVTRYNTKISVVPYNIIAKIFKFEKAELFDMETENDKK